MKFNHYNRFLLNHSDPLYVHLKKACVSERFTHVIMHRVEWLPANGYVPENFQVNGELDL
jgi:hypothetical protein